MDQQYRGLNDKLDALSQLFVTEALQYQKESKETSISSEKTTSESPDIETLRVHFSHYIPCRNWCPCSCHAKRKLRVTVPGILESIFGKAFIGYTGLPILNNRCDFRGCRDQQKSAVTMEYWLLWWFVSKNLRLYIKDLSPTGPQLQLSTARRVSDASQSIAFAMQGNIEGLKYLFDQGLASPRDVSNSRGYSLVRVSQPS